MLASDCVTFFQSNLSKRNNYIADEATNRLNTKTVPGKDTNPIGSTDGGSPLEVKVSATKRRLSARTEEEEEDSHDGISRAPRKRPKLINGQNTDPITPPEKANYEDNDSTSIFSSSTSLDVEGWLSFPPEDKDREVEKDHSKDLTEKSAATYSTSEGSIGEQENKMYVTENNCVHNEHNGNPAELPLGKSHELNPSSSKPLPKYSEPSTSKGTTDLQLIISIEDEDSPEEELVEIKPIVRVFGPKDLELVSSPAGCAPKKAGPFCVPLRASLHSLPLDEDDLLYISKKIDKRRKQKSLSQFDNEKELEWKEIDGNDRRDWSKRASAGTERIYGNGSSHIYLWDIMWSTYQPTGGASSVTTDGEKESPVSDADTALVFKPNTTPNHNVTNTNKGAEIRHFSMRFGEPSARQGQSKGARPAPSTSARALDDHMIMWFAVHLLQV